MYCGSPRIRFKDGARVSGNKRVELLSLDKLEPLTGYVRGGCSPLGMKKKFSTFIEHHAMEQKTIRISAGSVVTNWGAPHDLQQLTRSKAVMKSSG